MTKEEEEEKKKKRKKKRKKQAVDVTFLFIEVDVEGDSALGSTHDCCVVVSTPNKSSIKFCILDDDDASCR